MSFVCKICKTHQNKNFKNVRRYSTTIMKEKRSYKHPLDKKNSDIHIRFTDQEKEIIREYARVKRQSQSEFIRNIIIDTLRSEIDFIKLEIITLERELISKRAQRDHLELEIQTKRQLQKEMFNEG